MIEATCSACGTLNRVPEASVPVGAKFIACADCKARVPIAAGAATPPPMPPPVPGRPPAIPKAAGSVRASAPAAGGEIGLADLPAPKRTSALGGEPPRPPAKPAPGRPPGRSGLAAAFDPDLPAPKAPRAAGLSTTSPTLDLDDPLAMLGGDDGIDLPAPRKPARGLPELARDDARDDVIDLPAPRAVGAAALADLPAPKRAVARPAAEAPSARGPAGSPQIADLPAPKRTTAPAASAAPPRVAEAAEPALGGGIDLPAPKGFFDDLPQVKSHPTGGGVIDLPAPKGFFDDLPQVKSHPTGGGVIDLPAPKGFFDDLPQPALQQHADLPAPKGFFDDLPQPALQQRADLPAPKGFFDDLPQVKTHPASTPEVPAPKGYFDNIPGLPNQAKPELPAPQGFFDDIPGLPHRAKPELPVPQGHFDNIPGRPFKKSDELAPKGFFDDLPQGSGRPTRSPGAQDLELDSGPELELASPSSASPGTFDDLDLSKPSLPPSRFEPAPRPAPPPGPGSQGPPPGARFDPGPALELEGAVPGADAIRPAPVRPTRPAATTGAPEGKRERARRTKLALGGAALAVALGAGGFVFYQRHVAAQERADAIASQLAIARASYAASDPPHWQRAASAARRVIELDAANPEALGLAAESLLASAIADGTAAPSKIAQAKALLETASEAGIANPQLGRARALAMIAGHQADAALALLQPLATQAPKDATLALYLGWALEAKGDHAAAVKAFDSAAAGPRLAALVGRGNAKLELADLEGARGDFAAALELDRDHLGAQVGLAAAQPPSAAQQQESDLVAILARKDIATADPRVIARAWTLAGNVAGRAGRTSVARERFKKALAVIPQDLAATTGLAEAELADGKLGAAAELTAVALNRSKDDVPAQLVQAEIELKQGNLPLAAQRLAALASHATPLAPLEQARLQLVTGRLLETQGKDDAAVDAYMAGAKAAGDLDLAPLMAAVGKLATMTAAAVAAKDLPRAQELRGRSELLLGELATQAERDPRLAMALGMAYLQQGDADKAEPWLRRVLEARPNDAEARYQLGRALLKAGKHEAALEALKAALDHDASRSDIGVDLARAYEALGMDPEAGALYSKLLAAKDPSPELRTRAGLYFARNGAPAKAAEQGAKLLEADPHSAAGLYLKGEGLYAAGNLTEAKQAFQRAIESERDPLYLIALGRTAEAMALAGDRESQDLALKSYRDAAEADPPPLLALAGQGRLYVLRHEAAKAVRPLLAANHIDPNNAEVMFRIGCAYQELQQQAVALKWLEASVRIEPRGEAFWRIGQIDRDLNRGVQAADALGTATRLGLEHEKRTGKPLDWLTDALYFEGRVNFDLHSEDRARTAWRLFVGRSQPASARLSEVQQLLNTSLR